MDLLTLNSDEREERLQFAYKNLHRDWSEVMFSGVTVVGNIGIWGTITEYGPWKMRMVNGPYCAKQYVEVLDDIVLPFFTQNNNVVYAQVRFSTILKYLFDFLFRLFRFRRITK